MGKIKAIVKLFCYYAYLVYFVLNWLTTLNAKPGRSNSFITGGTITFCNSPEGTCLFASSIPLEYFYFVLFSLL